MLKVKNNVDLKELEKFGFKNYNNTWYEFNIYKHETLEDDEYYKISLSTIYDNRVITIYKYIEENDVDLQQTIKINNDELLCSFIPNLIKVDLIEKENENE